mmetsp:Transcript_59773/g.142636  ORF Transcript_59773/g.142636 Transcript_59773/m.142636 type:complete len:207 (+) Transcript_59773:633-1253(+)
MLAAQICDHPAQKHSAHEHGHKIEDEGIELGEMKLSHHKGHANNPRIRKLVQSLLAETIAHIAMRFDDAVEGLQLIRSNLCDALERQLMRLRLLDLLWGHSHCLSEEEVNEKQGNGIQDDNARPNPSKIGNLRVLHVHDDGDQKNHKQRRDDALAAVDPDAVAQLQGHVTRHNLVQNANAAHALQALGNDVGGNGKACWQELGHCK